MRSEVAFPLAATGELKMKRREFLKTGAASAIAPELGSGKAIGLAPALPDFVLNEIPMVDLAVAANEPDVGFATPP